MHVVPVTAVGSTGASPRRASGEGRRGGRAKMVEGRTQRAVIAKRDRMVAGESFLPRRAMFDNERLFK